MKKLTISKPVKKEVLSYQEFIDIYESGVTIESSRVIPPDLGDDNFGGVEVTYSYPILKPAEVW